VKNHLRRYKRYIYSNENIVYSWNGIRDGLSVVKENNNGGDRVN